jgi:DNA-binding NarL/FixJ family response regulator
MPNESAASRSGDGTLCPPLFSKHEWMLISEALKLTTRQAQIVDLVLRGQRDKEIVARLGLEKTTIRTHLTDIFAKLKVNSRIELAYRVFAEYRRLQRGGGSS